ncbi:MAG: MBL fold metallo-hydrolase [Kiritimatiellia bacterium]|jgi:ribonuclease BN (tRNA processing enzyme)
MPDQKLFMLGSASGVPTARRNTTAACLQAGARLYLLDAGDGCAGRMAGLGLDVNRVAAVFLSHMHIDHVGGLPLLLQTMQLAGRKAPLDICLPAEGRPGLEHWLNTVYLMPELLPFPLRWLGIRVRAPFYDDGCLRLRARRNAHLQVRHAQLRASYPVRGQSYSFQLECGRRRIVYSGDIRELDEVLPLLSGGVADWLLLECAHYPLDSAWAAFNGLAKTIVIHHIHPRLDRQGGAIKRAIKKHFTGKVVIARDGLVI